MKGPDFIAADGAKLSLTWHRLKPAAEVVAAVPAPGEPEMPQDAAGGWPIVVDDFTAGEGFDRRRFRIRRRPDPAKRLFVASGEVKADPSFLFEGRSIDSMGGEDSVSADDEDERVFRSLPLDRPWLATELVRFERLASEILEAHAYPVGVDWPLWRVIGDDLCWAGRPMVVGRIEGEVKNASLMDMGGLALEIGPLAENWPRTSPFWWALTVYRLSRPYRRTMAELVTAGCPAAPLEAIFQAAFELGSAMTDDTFRRLYDSDLRRGQATGGKDPVRQKGGLMTGSASAAASDAKWRTSGLKMAQDMRAQNPSWGGDQIAKLIRAALPAPLEGSVKRQLSKWEKDGLLPRSTSNPKSRTTS